MNKPHLPFGRPQSSRVPRLNRRAFLRGTGGIAVGLPLLTSLKARGDDAPPPKRFVVISTPNGVIPDDWYPTPGTSAVDFTLGANHQPLLPYQDKLVLFSGIDMPALSSGPGEPHQKGMGGVLTGWPLLEPSEETGAFVGGDGSVAGWGSSISVDQRIAQVIGASTRFQSLNLGVRASTAEVRSRISYLGPALPLPPQNDPRQTFVQLFSDFSTDEGSVARLQAQRRSVLDAVMGSFNLVSARVGAADRMRFEQHLDFVRELEQRLGGQVLSGGMCALPAEPTVAINPDDENQMPLITTLQMDMLTTAFACDLTRVATFQFSNAQNHIRFPWLDTTPDNPDEFTPSHGDGHALSHAGPSSTAQIAESSLRDTWYASQVAYLLDRLASTPEGEGTLLDNTAILWVNEISVGNTHSHSNMPFVLAGNAGGAFETGRFLQYDGASHCELLLALLNAYGVEDDVFGDPEFCEGPLAGLL